MPGRWYSTVAQWWKRLLGHFVPPSLAEDETQAARARSLIGFALSITLWAPVFTIVYLLLEAPVSALITVLVLPPALLTPWIIHRSGSLVLGGNWIAGLLYSTVIALSLCTGGYDAPALDWLVAVPATAILIAGVRSALLWLAAAIGLFVVFFALHGSAVVPSSEIAAEHAGYLRLAGDLGLAALLLNLAWVHGRQAVGIVLEANGRLRAEVEEHRATRARLRQAQQLEALGRLSAGLGHEINTPLAYVTANLELLRERLEEPADGRSCAEMKELVADARVGADQIREVVRDVTIFARGRTREAEPVALRPIVERSLRMLSAELRHRATLECEWGPTPLVLGDDARLGQVFVNLLVNAIHAIPAGDAAHHRIRVRTGAEPGHAWVEVADTGAGIPSRALDRIFEPFYTSRRNAGGTGLGLAICKDIVEGLAGSLEVQSVEGRGARFRVWLPMATAIPAQPEQGDEASGVEPARVLVADDDERLGRSLRRLLSRHRVTVVGSGAAALRACSTEDYDVVLCDLMMPDMTGLRVFEEVRASRPHLADRFLFMTGGALTRGAREFCEAMGDRVLDKPLDAERLRRRIEQLRRDIHEPQAADDVHAA